MQVLGHKDGLEVMEKADPLFLLVGLPTIPLALILGKMIRWEDHMLRFWRRHISKISLLSFFVPKIVTSGAYDGLPPREPADAAPLSDPVSATRVLCGGLIMPTVATLIGKVCYGFVESGLHRALLVRIPLLYSSYTIWFRVAYCGISHESLVLSSTVKTHV